MAQRRKIKKLGSYKSKAQQGRILAKKLTGKSNSQIAKEESIRRETVARILSQPELRAVVEQHQQEILSLVPDSITVFREELKHRGPEKMRAASEVLHGVQVFVTRQEKDVTTHQSDVAKKSNEELIQEAKEILASSGVQVIDLSRSGTA